MKKFLDLTVGFLGGIAFLGCGIAIFVWGIGKLQQVRATRDWPQVDGQVTESEIDRSRKETEPHVEYTYTVAGKDYTSRQIALDLFDKPGGEGLVETIVDRYPVGEKVTVHYDPDEPGTAVLEPEIYSPFFMPLFFGALFFCFGCFMMWRLSGLVRGEAVDSRSNWWAPRLALLAVIFSVLFYGVIILVSFESAVRETSVKAFGERPLGIPNLLFVLALQTALYLPMPWVFWHVARLAVQATQDGRRPGIAYLLTAGSAHPELRRSQFVCIGGLLYFVAICIAWIAYTSAIGI